MQLVSRKNFLLALAALLVIAFGYMALTLSGQIKRRPPTQTQTYESEIEKIETQSSSDEIDKIEEDLMNTDLNNLDSELQDIDKEIESSL